MSSYFLPFECCAKQINININQISLDLRNTGDSLSGDTGDQTDFSTINFSNNHNFNTGDKIFYTYSNGESLVGLNTGIYFTEKVGDKSIKLFGSPSGVADGKNITFSKSDNDGTHNFVLFSQNASTGFAARHHGFRPRRPLRSALPPR